MKSSQTARCFATVLITSLPLSLAMFAMLRHGALLLPRTTTLTASLAVAAMSATAMSLFHRLDASAMILIWNFGTALIVIAVGSLAGRKLFPTAY